MNHFRLGVTIAAVSLAMCATAQQMPQRVLEGDSTQAARMISPESKAAVIDLPAVQSPKKARLPDARRAGRLEVGFAREITSITQATEWRAVEGGYVARVSVRSPGSAGMRVQLEAPVGATVRVVALSGEANAGPVEALERTVEANVWTPFTSTETQLVEIFATGAKPANPLRVKRAVHFDASPVQAKASGACNVDTACPSGDAALDAAITERKKSVAWMNFVEDGSAFVCTGTVINTEKFPAPYFLTANHCIDRQDTASSLTTFFFREVAACGTARLNPDTRQVTGGADLIFNNYAVDSTLLLLRQPVPTGTVYAGYDATPVVNNTPSYAISAPRGDPLKYATGAMTDDNERFFDLPNAMYGVKWAKGITEPGSSGSGLFTLKNGSLQLRGLLTGALFNPATPPSCTNNDFTAVYSRFDAFYPQIARFILANPSTPADDYPNTMATAAPINPNTQFNGAIQYAGDLDMFKVTFTTEGTWTVKGGGGIDSNAVLYDGRGVAIRANDDAQTSALDFGIAYPVKPGNYFLQIGHFEPNGTGAYSVDAKFFPQVVNYSDIWWNDKESGWGINLNHQGDTVFAALYTYDNDRTPLWLVMSNGNKQADGSYAGDLFRTSNAAFNANPWRQPTTTRVGSMRIVFDTQTTATLTYSVNGVNVTKSITRFAFAKTQSRCEFTIFDRSYTFNLQDLWWNRSESGWGVFFNQQVADDGAIVFASMFNYDANGKAVWLVMSAGRFDSTGTLKGDLIEVTGPPFNTVPWTAVTATTAGSLTFAFAEDANGRLLGAHKGKLTFTYKGVTVSKDIERFVYSSPLPTCTTSSNPFE